MEARIVNRVHVGDFSSLGEVDKLAIAEPSLVLVVDSVTWLGAGASPLDNGQHFQIRFAVESLSADWLDALEVEKLVFWFAKLGRDPVDVLNRRWLCIACAITLRLLGLLFRQ